MRTMLLTLVIASLTTLSVAQAADPPKAPGAIVAPPTSDHLVVPRGKLYVLLNSSGQTMGQFQSGDKAPLNPVDCAQVPCPDTFDKNVVCWKCKERLKAK